jgi:hypothetical protein
MTDQNMTPLDDDVAQVLAQEREAPGPGDEVQARVWSRVEATLAASSVASAPVKAGVGPTSWWLGAAALVLVGAVAWNLSPQDGVSTAPHDPMNEAPVVAPVAPTAPPAPAASAASELEPAPTEPTLPAAVEVEDERPAARAEAPSPSVAPVAPVVEAATASRPAKVKPPSPAANLRAERRLIDQARAALSSGQSAGVIGALKRHLHRFPKGLLAEEREALWIRALVLGGRDDQAIDRAARFRVRYPGSIHRSAVETVMKHLEQ